MDKRMRERALTVGAKAFIRGEHVCQTGDVIYRNLERAIDAYEEEIVSQEREARIVRMERI